MSIATLKRLSKLLSAGDFSRAEQEVTQALTHTPSDPALLAFGAFIATRLGKSGIAVARARQAIITKNRQDRPLAQSANLLAHHRIFDEALAAAKSLRIDKVSDPVVLDQLGACFTACGALEHAETAYARLVDLVPQDPRCRFNLAAAQRYTGKLDKAYINFDAAARHSGPQSNEAAYARSLLRKATESSNHVKDLTVRLAQPGLDQLMKAQLFYALGKENEELSRCDEAFSAWQNGGAAMRASRPYSTTPEIDAMQATARTWKNGSQAGAEASLTPLFIVSLPRAGSTLLDRMLSAHPRITSAGETEDFIVSLLAEMGNKTNLSPAQLAVATADLDIQRVGERYRKAMQRRGHKSGFVIDKTPTNFLYAGLIAEALPEARIIEVRRDPRDAVLATFKTLFMDRYFWTYDLENAARYMVAQRQLMTHWHQGWSRRIEQVSYEDLVVSTEVETRRLINFLGLEWNAACLDPTNNKNAVATASAEHVRKPVYSSSIGTWRQFQQQLQPAFEIFKAEGLI